MTVTIAVTISDDAMQYWGSSSGVWSVLAWRLEFAGCRLEQNVRSDPETVEAGLGTGDGRVPQIVLTFVAGRADGWFHVKVSSRIERMSRWDFPKIKVPLFGVLITRILPFRVLYEDSLFSETPPYGS